MGNSITHAAVSTQPVRVPCGGAILDGDLAIPEAASGIVLFVHGSGSSRHSPRNRQVAEHLQEGGLATLLFDLLTHGEEVSDLQSGEFRFNIDLLAGRVASVTQWLRSEPATRRLKIGYFGASTGAAAALVAVAQHPTEVAAVVSRGGRPDLAEESLARVNAPTLLIVGGADPIVLGLNEQALARLRCQKELRVIDGATHLFEEPGTLARVARLARAWFRQYLR